MPNGGRDDRCLLSSKQHRCTAVQLSVRPVEALWICLKCRRWQEELPGSSRDSSPIDPDWLNCPYYFHSFQYICTERSRYLCGDCKSHGENRLNFQRSGPCQLEDDQMSDQLAKDLRPMRRRILTRSQLHGKQYRAIARQNNRVEQAVQHGSVWFQR